MEVKALLTRSRSQQMPDLSPGFTLIEVLTAMAILSFGLMALLEMTAVGRDQMALAEKSDLALQIVHRRMGDLVRTKTAVSGEETGNSGFHLVWQVFPRTPQAGLETVRVNVTWQSHGHEHQVVLRRLKRD